jgi:hypothetical protein
LTVEFYIGSIRHDWLWALGSGLRFSVRGA